MTENLEDRLLSYIYSQNGVESFVDINEFLKSFKITMPLLRNNLRKLESDGKILIKSSLFKLGNTIDQIHYDLNNLPIQARLLENGIQKIDNLKKELEMPNNKKVHTILKYLNDCHDSDPDAYEFQSDEIRLGCFKNLLSQEEVNFLCRILIDNKDVEDLNSKDSLNLGIESIGFIRKTEDAFLIEKYLIQTEALGTTLNINEINQTITASNSNISQFNNLSNKSNYKQEIQPKIKESKILWKIIIPIIVTVIASIIVYLIFGK